MSVITYPPTRRNGTAELFLDLTFACCNGMTGLHVPYVCVELYCVCSIKREVSNGSNKGWIDCLSTGSLSQKDANLLSSASAIRSVNESF